MKRDNIVNIIEERDLKSGEYRELDSRECLELYRLCGLSHTESF